MQILLDDRPGDILLAFEAAEKMGGSFAQRFRAGLSRLGEETQQAIRAVIGLGA